MCENRGSMSDARALLVTVGCIANLSLSDFSHRMRKKPLIRVMRDLNQGDCKE